MQCNNSIIDVGPQIHILPIDLHIIHIFVGILPVVLYAYLQVYISPEATSI